MNRSILTWIGVATLIALVVGGIYGYFTFSQITDDYRTRAERQAWYFADRVSFDIEQGEENALNSFVGQLVVGNVLYAQVVVEGDVTEKSVLASPIPSAQLPNGVSEIEHLKLDGESIWDVRYALNYISGFVRIGINLEPYENTLRMQALIIIGFGLAFIAVFGLIASLVIRRSDREPAPATAPSIHVSDSGANTVEETFVPTSTTEDFNSNHQPEDESHPPVVTADFAVSIRSESALHVGSLMIDNASKQVELEGEPVELSPKEFDLLYLLAKEPGKVFSNQEILTNVWADSHMATAQDVKQYIYFVRQKLEENPKKPTLIVTVRGFGYKLQD